MQPTSQREDRGMSASVSHILALGITALLISGLFIAASTAYENEQEKTTKDELQTIGNRLATEIARASRLAEDGGSLSITTRQRAHVGGMSYTVELKGGGDCDTDRFHTDTCLVLGLDEGQAEVTVAVENTTAIELDRGVQGSFTITANPSGTSLQTDTLEEIPPLGLQVGVGDNVTKVNVANTANLTNREPISGFVFSPGHPTTESTIHFESDADDLDGGINTYEWDLGDGTTKSTGEFNHSYANPGKYTVSLTVTDNDGASDTVTKTIIVAGLIYNEDPTAGNTSGSIEDGRLNFTVDNEHSAAAKINEILIDPENNSIEWLSTDPSGSENEIYIDGDLAAGGHDNSLDIHDGGRIFDVDRDGTVNDGDAKISAGGSGIEFDFKGFGPAEDSNPKTDMAGEDVEFGVRYTVDGTFYVTTFTVPAPPGGNEPPDPAFTDTHLGDREVEFDAGVSSDPDGSITSYEWDFGDGNTSTGVTVTNTYPTNGTYDVSLTVTDDNGTSSTLTKSVSFTNCSASSVNWYDDSWNHRKQITIDSDEVAGASSLKNFPLLVDLSDDSDLAAGAQADGDDIMFTQDCSQLSHEIESYDDSDGDLVAWVNVSALSASDDTELYMYYDNSGAANQEDVAGVWDDEYKAVWHLNESGTGTDRADSTGFSNDATPQNYDGNENQAGMFANGDHLDGNNEHLVASDSSSLELSSEDAATVQAWVRKDASQSGWIALAQKSDKSYNLQFWSGDDPTFATYDGGSWSTAYGPDLNSDTWYQVVGTYDGNEVKIYVDGSLSDTVSMSGSMDDANGHDVGIGENLDASGRHLNGRLDEVRIAGKAKSSEWIETEYNNQHDPSGFYSVSPQQALYEESGGEVVMEAENYMHTVPGNDDDEGPANGDDMSSHTWLDDSDSDASGNTGLLADPNWGYNARDTENGERLDYHVDFGTTGTYYVWVRMECPSGGDDSVHAGLNGTPESYGAIGLTERGSTHCSSASGWAWMDATDDGRVTVDVDSAGKHTVNIWMREDGTRIDKIVLTTDSSFTPSGDGPAESPTT